jgi:hypothetical protein
MKRLKTLDVWLTSRLAEWEVNLLEERAINAKLVLASHPMKLTYKGEAFYISRVQKPIQKDHYSILSRTFELSKADRVFFSKAIGHSSTELRFKLKEMINRNSTFQVSHLRDSGMAKKLDLVYPYNSRRDFKQIVNDIKYYWHDTPAGKAHEKRREKKYLKDSGKYILNKFVSMVGGVHTEKETFLKLYKEKLNRILDVSKKPMSEEAHVGIEIEFFLPDEYLKLFQGELVSSKYAKMLALGSDASLTSTWSGYLGKELRICAPASKLHEVLTFVSDKIRAYDGRVNASCGLHVHLDARKVTGYLPETMYKNLLTCQAQLYKLVPSSRRKNKYCTRSKVTDYGYTRSRYKAINSRAVWKYQTLEVRLHSGTIEAEKIEAWVRLLRTIAYGPAIEKKIVSVKAMAKTLNLSSWDSAFWVAREEKFKTA